MNNLESGDTILLIAPARKVTKNELQPFFHWAKTHNLLVEEAPNLYQDFHQFAGNDEQRATDLIWALKHPTAKAIFCARGGYGSIRTLLNIQSQFPDPSTFSAYKKKWLVGFSDITTIHAWLNQNGWESIHAPVAVQWNDSPEFQLSLKSLEQVLFKQQVSIDTSNLLIYNNKKFNGKLIGGNLSLVYAMQGSSIFNLENYPVLLIEDLDEYHYHIDRMIKSLEFNGVFQKISALLVGGISDLKDNTIPFGLELQHTLREIAEKYQIPVIFGLPVGHLPLNLSVILGANITFDGTSLKQNLN